MKQCKTCNVDLGPGDTVYVFWKWPGNNKVVRMCKRCAEAACDLFQSDLQDMMEELGGTKK